MKKGRLEKYVLLSSFYNIKEKGKVMPSTQFFTLSYGWLFISGP